MPILLASDRILALIRKGVTISQAASVMQNFSYAGIPVHAYLMYGFPTQRDQETIDSLEWVRQFFQRGILQSAFWHRFTMTVHSPVGMHPERFGAERIEEDVWFAANDLQHRDPSGGQHEKFSFGLRKSLLNYMHGIGWELPLQHWFAHKVPDTTIASDAMDAILVSNQIQNRTATHRIVWHGIRPQLSFQSKSKKGQVWENGILRFVTTEKTIEMTLEKEKALWWFEWLCKLERSRYGEITFGELMQDYETQGWDDFDLFWYNKPMASMCDAGLWVV